MNTLNWHEKLRTKNSLFLLWKFFSPGLFRFLASIQHHLQFQFTLSVTTRPH